MTILNDLAKVAKPFSLLGGPKDSLAAYHDLPDDTVIYENSGACITAGNVRDLRRVLRKVTTKI